MSKPIVKSARGDVGKVTMPSMGALIGELFRWQITIDKSGEVYDLRCMFQWIHELLWEQSEGSRRIEIQWSRDPEKWYELKPVEGAQIERKGRELKIRGVVLSKIE